VRRYLHVRSSYVLEIENILDLSHIAYLHPTTFGSGGVSKGEFESSQEGEVVWSKRATFDDLVPDSLADATGVPRGASVDRWMDVRWNAPANMMLYGGGVAAGKPRSEGRGVRQADWLKVPFETEDLPMLEAQQVNLLSNGGQRSFLLPGVHVAD
jgi:vanillate O-demethylase monooxygenase subunit